MVLKSIYDLFIGIIGKIKETSVVSRNVSDVLSGFIGQFNKQLDKTKGNIPRDELQGFLDGLSGGLSNLGLSEDTISAITLKFQELAESGEYAEANISDFYAILVDGKTHGIGNVKSLIRDYNALADSTGETTEQQKALASAIGQSNQKFGNYLSGIKNGKASMKGYRSSIITATAKTIGLQIASAALSMIISAGISFAITLITKVIHQMDDLKDKIDDLKSKLESTESEIESINSKLGQHRTYSVLKNGI